MGTSKDPKMRFRERLTEAFVLFWFCFSTDAFWFAFVLQCHLYIRSVFPFDSGARQPTCFVLRFVVRNYIWFPVRFAYAVDLFVCLVF